MGVYVLLLQYASTARSQVVAASIQLLTFNFPSSHCNTFTDTRPCTRPSFADLEKDFMSMCTYDNVDNEGIVEGAPIQTNVPPPPAPLQANSYKAVVESNSDMVVGVYGAHLLKIVVPQVWFWIAHACFWT